MVPWKHIFSNGRSIGQAETQIVVAIIGRVVVAIRNAAVLRVVVPRPTAIHPVRASLADDPIHNSLIAGVGHGFHRRKNKRNSCLVIEGSYLPINCHFP